MENRFNLIDEPWIPVADYGRVSLRDIFSRPEYQSLGGNPVQKIAAFKLLLAIAQAAATPADEKEWQALGAQGLADKCLAYLDKWHDRFYLYGEKPFLQMPAIVEKINQRTERRLTSATTAGKKKEATLTGEAKGFGSGFYPDLPSENNTFLSHTLMDRGLSDSERALFVVTLMNFAFGGKRVEADLTSLGEQQLGNRHTAKAGPSLGGYWGYLHSFVMAGHVVPSLWLNLMTIKDVEDIGLWKSGIGIPIWESMPSSESDIKSESHKNSYMATLVALCRFVMLFGDGIYYLEGISYPSTREGWYEPSLTLDRTGSDIKVKYVDPEKRPWRELEGLLSFAITGHSSGFECFGVKQSIERARGNLDVVCFWSGGIRASSNSGDQSVKQSDDFVESNIWLETKVLEQVWSEQLKQEMNDLNALANTLYRSVQAYFKAMTVDGKNTAAQATNMFWQLCERDFQELVGSCDSADESRLARQRLRKKFAGYQHLSYDHFCPNETARQIDAWAQNRPNHYKYISQEAS